MNSIYYELAILEQQINYFVLESKYNEIVLNESIGIKIKSKDSIREEFCNEALNFTDTIMNDLF